MTEPIGCLAGESYSFDWRKEQDKALKADKNCFQKFPVMAMYNAPLPILLSTEASDQGLRAI